MADSFKIAFKIAFHFNCHPILEQVLFLGQKLRRQIADTLLRILAVGGTAKIHLRIDETVSAIAALARRIVFEKLHCVITLGALDFKNCTRLPVLRVLSGTFHG